MFNFFKKLLVKGDLQDKEPEIEEGDPAVSYYDSGRLCASEALLAIHVISKDKENPYIPIMRFLKPDGTNESKSLTGEYSAAEVQNYVNSEIEKDDLLYTLLAAQVSLNDPKIGYPDAILVEANVREGNVIKKISVLTPFNLDDDSVADPFISSTSQRVLPDSRKDFEKGFFEVYNKTPEE